MKVLKNGTTNKLISVNNKLVKGNDDTWYSQEVTLSANKNYFDVILEGQPKYFSLLAQCGKGFTNGIMGVMSIPSENGSAYVSIYGTNTTWIKTTWVYTELTHTLTIYQDPNQKGRYVANTYIIQYLI